MKYVYAFAEGSKEQKFLLGGKGANLAEMTKLGLPVPPGFTITTDACKAYMAGDDTIPDGLMDEVAAALAHLHLRLRACEVADVDRADEHAPAGEHGDELVTDQALEGLADRRPPEAEERLQLVLGRSVGNTTNK